jgi:phage terminase large subunit-like protein
MQTSSPESPPFNPSLLLKQLLAEQERRANRNRLTSYRPYPRQLEFHAAGRDYRERLLRAGNQVGKTWCAGMEMAAHMTGRYPDWWEGRRFDRPVRCMAGSESAELTRKGVQRILLGTPEDKGQWGTGAIPADCLVHTTARQGVPDAVASITVKHVSGGNSSLQTASYDQGRSKWQAESLDVVWLDEEPPLAVYGEAIARTAATGGCLFLTFTPLMGMTQVVSRFLLEKPAGTHVTQMTLADAEHMTPERQAEMLAAYPEHERAARARGEPQLGSGRVFPVDESSIKVASFPIPEHWARIGGLDFGWDHPQAAAAIAWDRDADVIYVTHCHRARQQTPALFVPSIKGWGPWPYAWPHDGLQTDKGSGEQLAKQYRSQGLPMLVERATHEDGGSGVEAGITEILERMQTGRFKVWSHLSDWFEEFGIYHRKDGLIVKLNDDLMSATRYAVMMKRYAKTLAQLKPKRASFAAPPAPPSANGWMG